MGSECNMRLNSPSPFPLPEAEPYPQNLVLNTAGRAEKSETRNKSQIRNQENADESRLVGTPRNDDGRLEFWIFGLLNLFRISDLENSNLNQAD